MAYITVQQAAAQWHCAADWLVRLCQSGRLPGAVKRADGWYIPADTTPPPHTAHLPMPLMNTAFVPGHCLDTVEAIADEHLRNIALAEFYYFSGHAEEAACAAELYLSHPDAALRLSACLIYAYANLTLGQPHRVRRALEQVRASLDDPAVAASPGLHAAAVFIVTTAAVLLHLPPLAGADDLRDTCRLGCVSLPSMCRHTTPTSRATTPKALASWKRPFPLSRTPTPSRPFTCTSSR